MYLLDTAQIPIESYLVNYSYKYRDIIIGQLINYVFNGNYSKEQTERINKYYKNCNVPAIIKEGDPIVTQISVKKIYNYTNGKAYKKAKPCDEYPGNWIPMTQEILNSFVEKIKEQVSFIGTLRDKIKEISNV